MHDLYYVSMTIQGQDLFESSGLRSTRTVLLQVSKAPLLGTRSRIQMLSLSLRHRSAMQLPIGRN